MHRIALLVARHAGRAPDPVTARSVAGPASPASLACPDCGSTEVRRLSLVYRQGTSKSLTTTVGVGSFGGGAAYGQAFSEGFHQSLLSRDVAPPTQRGLVGPISAAVFGALLLAAGGAAAMNDGGNAAAAALVFGVMLLLGGWWLAGQASAYNRNTFPEALAEWEQSFICFRCGEVFTPGKDRGADAYDGDDADTV